MTFGSTFGRVLSPTFQPSSQAAAGGTWWDLNGTLTSCVAAYQPKGAADYAASKVNLANPGTYNATDINAPDWATATGWYFSGVNKGLNAAYPSDTKPVTYIARIKCPADAAAQRAIFGTTKDSGAVLRINTNNSITFTGYGAFDVFTAGAIIGDTDMVIAVTYDVSGNWALYIDGSLVNSGTNDKTFVTASYGQIGVARNNSTDYIGYIYALAVDNIAINGTQVSALTTAMNAL